jgi:hypothetical protein
MLVPGYAHDLFLSYAHADAIWVQAFKKAFSQQFHEREGQPVSIWQDSMDLRPGTKWTAELEEGIKRAAALLAIVSPAYRASDWCTEERDFLLNHYGSLEGLSVGGIYRLLKIVKLPPKYDLFGDLQDIKFFHEGTKDHFDPDSHEFLVATIKAVTAIRELFRLMSNGQTSVFLGRGPMETKPDRDQLQNELTGRGFKVRPGFALGASDSPEVLVKEMEPCSRVIFILGGRYDKFVEQQIKQAAALKKPCLFWIQPRLSEHASPEQQRLLDRLRDGSDRPAGSEILGGQSVTALMQQLEPKLKDEVTPRTTRTETGKPLVYLIFDATLSAESEAATRLTGILSDRNLHVIPYGRHEEHERQMQNSDGALLLRATRQEPDWWLRLFAQEVILNRRFSSKALVLGDSARRGIAAGDVPVIDYSDPFSAHALDPFIEKLRRAGSADASL